MAEVNKLPQEQSTSSERQPRPICGFIPPHVLKHIAESTADIIDDETRNVARATLDLKAKVHAAIAASPQRTIVSSHARIAQLERSGFIPPQVIDNVAHAKKAGIVAGQEQEPLAGAALPGQGQDGKRVIYDCKQTSNLPGTLARAEGQSRTQDRPINNVYDGFGITRNFYKTIFGRNSLDDKGMQLVASTHFRDNGRPFNNAFWSSEIQQMVFGDGDGVVFDYLTDSLDVIAHELTHGVVEYTCNLAYQDESGALNESCADVFACMVEQWHQGVKVDDADWILGQTLFPVAFRGRALRSLEDPGSAYKNDPVLQSDDQPKYYANRYTGTGDNGGVHINSGIPNHAFYLASTAVGGYSWEKVGKVWYETLTSPKIPKTCDFKTWAGVTVEKAGELFADEPAVKTAIQKAWVTVGVLDSSS
ncbi:hypothetical protein BDY21DRAFT_367027 [Lineolata rhizophorae]|uniref:Uncharacterized protein n=1 Tax=Lineolata rhizophorae TaxID=578093 RepID=A0A6A6NP89_9PEZI|nr:hypothetical protein BDY21DRAFT_367027 [Lineolata rhizophorae]